jgi:hypothetical protein
MAPSGSRQSIPAGSKSSTAIPFSRRLGREIEPVCGELRSIIEQADGSIWMGTASHGVLVWRHGRLEQVGAAQG